MKDFWLALAALAVAHTLVSFAAYRLLTETRNNWASTETPPVETTTPAEQARDIRSFEIRERLSVTKIVPTPVIFYMWSGYAGLAAAVLYLAYFKLRYG